MNKLNNGTEYRKTNEGYFLQKGKRQIFIIAKSAESGNKARELIANTSFNQIFIKGRIINILGKNISSIKFD